MDSEAEFATVARETFEYGVVTWAGRKYEEWVRTWSRPHPRDPRGLVEVPEPIYTAYQQRTLGKRLSSRQAEALGYPRVPGEQQLAQLRKELHEALGRCDWDRANDIDAELQVLQTRVAATRLTALKPRTAVG